MIFRFPEFCLLFFESFLSSRLKKGIISTNYFEDAAEDGSNVVRVETGT